MTIIPEGSQFKPLRHQLGINAWSLVSAPEIVQHSTSVLKMACVCSTLPTQIRIVWLRILQRGWNMSIWHTILAVFLPGVVYEPRNISDTGYPTQPQKEASPLCGAISEEYVMWPDSFIKEYILPVPEQAESGWQPSMVIISSIIVLKLCNI